MHNFLRRIHMLILQSRMATLEAEVEDHQLQISASTHQLVKAQARLRHVKSKLAVITPAQDLLQEALGATRTRL